MKMKQAMILAALTAGLVGAGDFTGRAQDAAPSRPTITTTNVPGHAVRGGMNFDAIAQALGLSEDQKPKVTAVLEDMMKQLHALRTDKSLSREDMRAKAKGIFEQATDKLKEILTPEQLAKWEHRPGGHPRANLPKPPAVPVTTNSAAATPKQ